MNKEKALRHIGGLENWRDSIGHSIDPKGYHFPKQDCTACLIDQKIKRMAREHNIPINK